MDLLHAGEKRGPTKVTHKTRKRPLDRRRCGLQSSDGRADGRCVAANDDAFERAGPQDCAAMKGPPARQRRGAWAHLALCVPLRRHDGVAAGHFTMDGARLTVCARVRPRRGAHRLRGPLLRAFLSELQPSSWVNSPRAEPCSPTQSHCMFLPCMADGESDCGRVQRGGEHTPDAAAAVLAFVEWTAAPRLLCSSCVRVVSPCVLLRLW